MPNQCNKTGCAEVAKWAPKINLPMKGVPKDGMPPITGILGLKLCDEHIDTIRVEEFPDLAVLLSSLVQGMPVELKEAWFTRVALDSEEFKAYDDVKKRSMN